MFNELDRVPVYLDMKELIIPTIDTFVPFFHVVSNIPNTIEHVTQHYKDCNIVQYSTDGDLYVYPEYRGSNYNVELDIYMEGYDFYHLSRTIPVNEKVLPPITVKDAITTFSNLILDDIHIEFSNYFEYPYMDKVRISTSFDIFSCNLQGYGINTLDISANLRDIYYPFDVIVTDDKLNVSNQDVILHFQEEPPLYIITPTQDITVSRKRYTSNLDTYFNCNIDGTNIIYNHVIIDTNGSQYVPRISIYDNLHAVERYDNMLYIDGDNRDETYIIEVTAYLDGYSNQTETIQLNVTEEKIVDLSNLETVVTQPMYKDTTDIIYLSNYFNVHEYPYFNELVIYVM